MTKLHYYPFGMAMPSRNYTAGTNYRYGFNGKENDKDIGESVQDYGMRIYDGRLGRFLSVDPLTKKYPWYTPYQFAGNDVIRNIDLDGLEPFAPFQDPISQWIFDIVMDWKFGDPTGLKTLRDGIINKAAVETRNASYHNSSIPESVQQHLDKANMQDANARIAVGLGKLTKFNVETSADVVSTFVPAEEVVVMGIKNVLELTRFKYAAKIYKALGITGDELASHLKYYDFSKKVYSESLEEGTELVQYRIKNGAKAGDYYAPKGTKPEEIGLDPTDIKETYDVKLKEKVDDVLVSTHKRNKELYYDKTRKSIGGGTQYFSKKIAGKATFTKR